MSFYGNTYYYTASTFARFVLKNLGLNQYVLPTSIPATDIQFDAENRASGLGISSGNGWIALTGEADQGFAIHHNKPGPAQEDIPQMEIISTLPEGAPINNLNFDTLIQVPVLSYDLAGHITNAPSVQFFKMPENPLTDTNVRMDNIETRMNAIDGQDIIDAGGTDTSSVRAQLLQQMSDTRKYVDEEVAKVGDWEDRIKACEDANTTEELDIQRLLDYVVNGWKDEVTGEERTGILTRLSVLQKDVDNLKLGG